MKSFCTTQNGFMRIKQVNPIPVKVCLTLFIYEMTHHWSNFIKILFTFVQADEKGQKIMFLGFDGVIF